MANCLILFLFTLLILTPCSATLPPEKPFVFIVTSYCNEQWVAWNLGSIFAQQYSNYRIIYVVDDASQDATAALVRKYARDAGQSSRITVIENEQRRGALPNRYDPIQSCADDEIMVMLDGDDALARADALALLNQQYQSPDCWMTYSGYQQVCTNCMYERTGHPSSCRHGRTPISHEAFDAQTITNKTYRTARKGPMHLRTFYAWLFKTIPADALKRDGEWFDVGTDTVTFYNLIERAHTRAHFMPTLLYLYNCSNPHSVSNDARNNKRAGIVAWLQKQPPAATIELH